MTLFRWIAGFAVIIGGVLTLSYLQGRFDHGDLKKALQAIQIRFPETSQCQARLISRFQGKVEVTCDQGAWVVDVVRGTIEVKKSSR